MSDEELSEAVLNALDNLVSSGRLGLVSEAVAEAPVEFVQTLQEPVGPDGAAHAEEEEGITMVTVNVKVEPKSRPCKPPVEVNIAFPVQPKSPTEEPSPVEEALGDMAFDVVGDRLASPDVWIVEDGEGEEVGGNDGSVAGVKEEEEEQVEEEDVQPPQRRRRLLPVPMLRDPYMQQ
jgi:hypothetical protein